MKLYPVYCTPTAAKFYLAVDNEAELKLVDGDETNDRFAWQGRTHKFAHALREMLGLFTGDNNLPRFVRANYESDGIFVCKTFGPAQDALLAKLKLTPVQGLVQFNPDHLLKLEGELREALLR